MKDTTPPVVTLTPWVNGVKRYNQPGHWENPEITRMRLDLRYCFFMFCLVSACLLVLVVALAFHSGSPVIGVNP